MSRIINEQDLDPLMGIIRHKEGVDVMPANSNLAALEISLVGSFYVSIFQESFYLVVKQGYIFCEFMKDLSAI